QGSGLPVPAITRLVSGSYTRPSHTEPPPPYFAQSPTQLFDAFSWDPSSMGWPGAGGTVWNFHASAPSLRSYAAKKPGMKYSPPPTPTITLSPAMRGAMVNE